MKDLAYDDTLNCVQCGMCLPACPTYKIDEKEASSPRGRIALVKAAAEGKIDLVADLSTPIDLCIGCRACEAACPSGVKYGAILESAKQTIESNRPRKPAVKFVRKLIFNQLFPYPKRFKVVTSFIWLYQKTGIQKVAQKTGITNKLPMHMGEFEQALQNVPAPTRFLSRKNFVPAKGTKKATVAFFTGCVQDAAFYETNQKSIDLLTSIGCDVVISQTQTCCGALHSHAGEMDGAKELAKRNIKAFEETGADWYVNNAGGCGAMLIEYDHLLVDDPEWKERAKEFVRKTKDLNVILAEFGPLPFQKQMSGRVTYQDSCHLRNVQHVISQPRQLLKSIPGIEYVELPGADMCCGSGGIYNFVQYEESKKVLNNKMQSVQSIDPSVIVTTNPGCLLQMRIGIEREGLSDRVKAVHIVDLLHEACGLSK